MFRFLTLHGHPSSTDHLDNSHNFFEVTCVWHRGRWSGCFQESVLRVVSIKVTPGQLRGTRSGLLCIKFEENASGLHILGELICQIRNLQNELTPFSELLSRGKLNMTGAVCAALLAVDAYGQENSVLLRYWTSFSVPWNRRNRTFWV